MKKERKKDREKERQREREREREYQGNPCKQRDRMKIYLRTLRYLKFHMNYTIVRWEEIFF